MEITHGSSVEQIVRGIIDKQLAPKEPYGLDASFAETLGADSLDQVELAMAFEEVFNLEIPEDDRGKISTVGQTIEYLKKRLS